MPLALELRSDHGLDLSEKPFRVPFGETLGQELGYRCCPVLRRVADHSAKGL